MVTVPSAPDREEAKKGNTLSMRPEVSCVFMGRISNNCDPASIDQVRIGNRGLPLSDGCDVQTEGSTSCTCHATSLVKLSFSPLSDLGPHGCYLTTIRASDDISQNQIILSIFPMVLLSWFG